MIISADYISKNREYERTPAISLQSIWVKVTIATSGEEVDGDVVDKSLRVNKGKLSDYAKKEFKKQFPDINANIRVYVDAVRGEVSTRSVRLEITANRLVGQAADDFLATQKRLRGLAGSPEVYEALMMQVVKQVRLKVRERTLDEKLTGLSAGLSSVTLYEKLQTMEAARMAALLEIRELVERNEDQRHQLAQKRRRNNNDGPTEYNISL